MYSLMSSRKDNLKDFERYHWLSGFREAGLNSDEDKKLFAKEYPILAAEYFYHVGDNQLGRFIYNIYSESYNEEFRDLANTVKLVLDSRTRTNLPKILGMEAMAELPGERCIKNGSLQVKRRDETFFNTEY